MVKITSSYQQFNFVGDSMLPFGLAVLYNEFLNKSGELSYVFPFYEFDDGLEHGKWLYGIDYDGRR